MTKNEIMEVTETEVSNVFNENNRFYESIFETDDYIFYVDSKGEKRKSYVYKAYNFIECKTDEDKKILFKAFDENSKISQPMSNCAGEKLNISGFITKPYKKIDPTEEIVKTGVVTLIKTVEGNYYVTISKQIYFSIVEMSKTFDFPFEVEIISKKLKLENGKTVEQLNLVLA